jgi:hypothetical protein
MTAVVAEQVVCLPRCCSEIVAVTVAVASGKVGEPKIPVVSTEGTMKVVVA